MNSTYSRCPYCGTQMMTGGCVCLAWMTSRNPVVAVAAAVKRAEKAEDDLKRYLLISDAAALEKFRETSIEAIAMTAREHFSEQLAATKEKLELAEQAARYNADIGDQLKARAVKAETALLDTVALAQTYGWNGVENSKILWIFFRDLIGDLEKQRDEFAAALVRQTDKCQAWQAAFERIDEDNMRPEDFGALYAVYQRRNDSEAQEAAESILDRVKREAQEKQEPASHE